MTGLGQWLAGVLNAHIERHNVPAATIHVRDTGETLTQTSDGDWEPARPCWACGDPVGFRTFHLPCWNVPPFKRNAETPQRTYDAGSVL